MANTINTAAVSWTDNNGVHLRVYQSDGYTVTERCYDQGAWTTGGFSEQGDGVSATTWQQNGGPSIRVYCTFEDNTTEYCWDTGGGGWYKGAYTQG
jgi:hypothetical protein